MEFVEPIPPTNPSIAEQRDALKKGLGRVMQWAMVGKMDDDQLRQACLVDHRYDQQVEDGRGAWLWQVIKTVKGQERFREPLLDAMTAMADERSACQLCELGYFYAAMGEERFRSRLYEIVEQCQFPTFAPSLGEAEILRLDGRDALVFIARRHGTLLERREWAFEDDHFIDLAIEQMGEGRVLTTLEGCDDRFVKRFHDCWRNRKCSSMEFNRPALDEREQRIQTIRVDEIIADAENQRGRVGLFRGWGMHASDDDLKKVVEALWLAQNPSVIVSYLRILSNRALPVFDARLIDFCRHSDDVVRRLAFNALKMNAHPVVREFAIVNIRQGFRDRFLESLFIRNYVPGDEDLILDALELPEDIVELHWLFKGIIEVLKNNPDADPWKLALIAYARTPCTECRFDAVKLLHAHNLIPPWMPSECQIDCNIKLQNLFQSTPGNS